MFQYMLTWVFAHLRTNERGQDLIEYAMLGGLLALAIMAAILLLAGPLAAMAAGIGRCIDFDSTTVCAPF